MRSKKTTIQIPHVLWDDFVEFCKDQYPSTNAGIQGLIQFCLAHPQSHWLTSAIAKLPIDEQDQINAVIVRSRKFPPKHGSLLDHVMERAVAKVANGQDIPKDRILNAFLEELKSLPPEDKE